jgi:hypothetical protein
MRTAGPWSGVQEVLLALALALTSRGAEHTIWNGDKRSVEFLYEDHFHRNIPLVGKRDLPVESQVGGDFRRPRQQGLPAAHLHMRSRSHG